MEALAAFTTDPSRYDAVITDERMPGMAGTVLAQEIRRLSSDVPILLTTGFANDGLVERSRAIGVKEVLKKPFRLNDLAAALERTIYS